MTISSRTVHARRACGPLSRPAVPSGTDGHRLSALRRLTAPPRTFQARPTQRPSGALVVSPWLYAHVVHLHLD